MNMNVATLTKKIVALPVEDRLHLFDSIWQSLSAEGWQPALTHEVREELDRRIEALDMDPANVMTWDQVEAYVRRKR